MEKEIKRRLWVTQEEIKYWDKYFRKLKYEEEHHTRENFKYVWNEKDCKKPIFDIPKRSGKISLEQHYRSFIFDNETEDNLCSRPFRVEGWIKYERYGETRWFEPKYFELHKDEWKSKAVDLVDILDKMQFDEKGNLIIDKEDIE